MSAIKLTKIELATIDIQDLNLLQLIFRDGIKTSFGSVFDSSTIQKFCDAEISNPQIGLNTKNISQTAGLNPDTTWFLVAKNGEKHILGYCGLRLKNQQLYLEDLFVAKNYRDCGVGSWIINQIIKKYPNQDLYSSVVKKNLLAVNFYQKMGFEIAERKTGKFNNLDYEYYKIVFQKQNIV